MTVNVQGMINSFLGWRNKITYDMNGHKLMANSYVGYNDCSGGMCSAVSNNGAPIALASTVGLGAELQKAGFTRIAVNQDWNSKAGDIILMSWGSGMASSGGAGGHVGMLIDANNFISVDYWTGGAAGSAVSTHNWNDYYNMEARTGLQYVEVWRYVGSTATVAPKPVAAVKPVIKQTETFECGDVIYIKSTATAYEGGSAINKADVTKRFTVVDVKSIKEYNSMQALLISTPTDKNKWLFGQDAGVVSRPNVKQDTSFNIGDQIYYKASATRYFGGPAIPVSLRTTQGEIIQTRGFQAGEAVSKSNQLVQVKGDEHWLYAQDVGLVGRVNPTLK